MKINFRTVLFSNEHLEKLFYKSIKLLFPMLCPEMMCLITIILVWLMSLNNFKDIKEMITPLEVWSIITLLFLGIGNLTPFVATLFKIKLNRSFSIFAVIAALVTLIIVQLWIMKLVPSPFVSFPDWFVFFFAFLNFIFIITIVVLLLKAPRIRDSILKTLYENNPIGLKLLILLVVTGNLSMWSFLHFHLFSPPVAAEFTIHLGILIAAIYKTFFVKKYSF
ncbi:MAG: hypothetical protein AAB019_08270 [Planctomycetota bacterium]